MGAKHSGSLARQIQVIDNDGVGFSREQTKVKVIQNPSGPSIHNIAGRGFAGIGTVYPINSPIDDRGTISDGIINVTMSSQLHHYVKINLDNTDPTINLINLIRGLSTTFTIDLTNNIALSSLTFTPALINSPTLNLGVGERNILHIVGHRDSTETRFEVMNRGGENMIPDGNTENQHLEWDNSSLAWVAVTSSTYGATGPFADSGFLRFANNEIILGASIQGGVGNGEFKFDFSNRFDFTRSDEQPVILQLRAQHATASDQFFQLTQISGVGGLSNIDVSTKLGFRATGSDVFNYDQNRIETEVNILPDMDGTLQIGGIVDRFLAMYAAEFSFDTNIGLHFNTGGAVLNVDGAGDTFVISVGAQRALFTSSLTDFAGNVKIGSNLEIGGFIDIPEIGTPSDPTTDVGRLYVKDLATVTTLFFRDSDTNETNLMAMAATNSISQLDSSATITDTGTDGKFEVILDGTSHIVADNSNLFKLNNGMGFAINQIDGITGDQFSMILDGIGLTSNITAGREHIWKIGGITEMEITDSVINMFEDVDFKGNDINNVVNIFGASGVELSIQTDNSLRVFSTGTQSFITTDTNSQIKLAPEGVIIMAISNDSITIDSGVDIRINNSFVTYEELSFTAVNPSANKGRMYAKDVSGITTPMWLDSAGTETSMIAGGGGGGIAFPIIYSLTTGLPTTGHIDLNLNQTSGHYFIIDELTGDIDITFTNPPANGFAQAYRIEITKGVTDYTVTFNDTLTTVPIIGEAGTVTKLVGDIVNNGGVLFNIFTMTSTTGSGNNTSFISFTADAELDMGTFNVLAGGAGLGVVNAGHIDFVDNLATPAAAISLYSDGVSLFSNSDFNLKGNTLKDVSTIEFQDGISPLPSINAIWTDSFGMKINAMFGDTLEFTIDGSSRAVIKDSEFGITAFTTQILSQNFLVSSLNIELGNAPSDLINFLGTIATAPNYVDGVKQTFNPNTTNAGINIGIHATDPTNTDNADMYYNSTNNKLRAFENGAWVDMIGGGGGSGANQQLDNLSGTVRPNLDLLAGQAMGGNFGSATVGDEWFNVYTRRLQFPQNSSVIASNYMITRDSSTMSFNVPTGALHSWSINGTTKMDLTFDRLQLSSVNLDMDENIIFNVDTLQGASSSTLIIDVPTAGQLLNLSFQGVPEWTFSDDELSGQKLLLSEWFTLVDSGFDPITDGMFRKNGDVLGLQIPEFSVRNVTTIPTEFASMNLVKVNNPNFNEVLGKINFQQDDSGLITYSSIVSEIVFPESAGRLRFSVISNNLLRLGLEIKGSSASFTSFLSLLGHIDSNLTFGNESNFNAKIFPTTDTIGITFDSLSYTVGDSGSLGLPSDDIVESGITIAILDTAFGNHEGCIGFDRSSLGVSRLWVKESTGDWSFFNRDGIVTS